MSTREPATVLFGATGYLGTLATATLLAEERCRLILPVRGQRSREEVLLGLSTGKVTFDNGLPVRVFWTTVYQTVMEGMFSDPIYGGNRNKAGWKLIGFPGVVAVHRENVEKYRGKKYTAEILGIADLS